MVYLMISLCTQYGNFKYGQENFKIYLDQPDSTQAHNCVITFTNFCQSKALNILIHQYHFYLLKLKAFAESDLIPVFTHHV